jgi:O-acetyl-ADP-ribose deacetylase (regulator of RNase III)
LAIEKGAKSIVFPCISTGVYSYPKRAAAAIALSVMREHTDVFERVVACCFGAEDAALYKKLADL